MLLSNCYAEGVKHQSPGSRSAPWVPSTERQANPNGVPQDVACWCLRRDFGGAEVPCGTPLGFDGQKGNRNRMPAPRSQGAARPWALMFNAFGVKRSARTFRATEIAGGAMATSP